MPGLAIGVASIGLQVYTSCIQGIQLLVTAINFPDECRYLNLRLRMEQQRLFAWSETSGLLDLDAKDNRKVLESNTFVLHRQTVLDLLVQVQCLFREFQDHQSRNRRLQVSHGPDADLDKPEKDAAEANLPLSARRRDFIKKAMRSLKETSQEAVTRLRWISLDKVAFETLLSKFSALNDSMTDILDARMQVEIHHAVQETNRGMLQLHRKVADLGRLVMALDVKLGQGASTTFSQLSAAQRAKNESGLQAVSQLAKFKAFNQSIESGKNRAVWDEAAAMCLGLGQPHSQDDLTIERSRLRLGPAAQELDLSRCEAFLVVPGAAEKRVWVEWKEYERPKPGDPSPPREVIWERVQKLSALLNHRPKPEAFRTPHCLGFFDMATPDEGGDADNETCSENDVATMRLGLVFERPHDEDLDPSHPPVSLYDLVHENRKPSVTDRIKLASAISSCLLSLHVVNWLHKGLRSHNILFFRTKSGRVDYTKPYVSGFDFSRPARPDEMTDIPGDNAEFNLYRHPHAQATHPGERERFKKSFDIYSLGVVLVEIAHWASLDQVLQIDLNRARVRPSIALRVRETLLAEDKIAELGASMGVVYEDATRKCIVGGRELDLEDSDDEADDAVAGKLSVAFYERVVRRLAAVRV
ncbi:hypothetical protein GQ53DRAFT_813689 [Thozetella sp. PMI_491]|nr:hypothetical protein GQ53DRAFT_813689 [Thozetella sp. PMI_491]